MAFQAINTGTTPDDHSGDPNRTAWTKANANFVELYTALALAAVDSEVAASLALLAQTDAELAAALALKLDASALAGVPDMDMIIRRDQAQAVISQQRLQFAKNAGTLVTLAFELLPATIAIDGAYGYTLPRMPKGFRLADANLTFHIIAEGLVGTAWLATVTLVEVAPPLDILQCLNQNIPVTGVLNLPVVSAEALMNAARQLELSITFADGDPYEVAGEIKGMTLFLRGVWTD